MSADCFRLLDDARLSTPLRTSASIDLGHGASLDFQSQLGGAAVYAAKFQLLRTEYKAWDRVAGLALTEFQLHPDTTFAGAVVLGEGDETEGIAQLSVEAGEDRKIEHGDTDDDYWEAFEEAEERMLDYFDVTEHVLKLVFAINILPDRISRPDSFSSTSSPTPKT
jgi:hypothetical protein